MVKKITEEEILNVTKFLLVCYDESKLLGSIDINTNMRLFKINSSYRTVLLNNKLIKMTGSKNNKTINYTWIAMRPNVITATLTIEHVREYWKKQRDKSKLKLADSNCVTAETLKIVNPIENVEKVTSVLVEPKPVLKISKNRISFKMKLESMNFWQKH
jgi:hypothetical protein